MNGKGDKQRKRQIAFDEYLTNWERIFSKKTSEEQDGTLSTSDQTSKRSNSLRK